MRTTSKKVQRVTVRTVVVSAKTKKTMKFSHNTISDLVLLTNVSSSGQCTLVRSTFSIFFRLELDDAENMSLNAPTRNVCFERMRECLSITDVSARWLASKAASLETSLVCGQRAHLDVEAEGPVVVELDGVGRRLVLDEGHVVRGRLEAGFVVDGLDLEVAHLGQLLVLEDQLGVLGLVEAVVEVALACGSGGLPKTVWMLWKSRNSCENSCRFSGSNSTITSWSALVS